VGPFGCFALFRCGGGSGPDPGWAMAIPCKMGGFLAIGTSPHRMGARFPFPGGAVELLAVVVFGVVLTSAQLADRGGPGADCVVAKLQVSFAVGRGVLPYVFPEGALCPIKGQERVGFVVFLGDLSVRLDGHNNRRFDFVFDPEGRDGFYPLWSVGESDVRVESRQFIFQLCPLF